MRARQRTTTTPGEAAAIMGICFGYSIVMSFYAVASGFPDRGFSDSGLIWLAGSELVLGAAALGVLYMRGYAIASLVPTPTLMGSILGIGLSLGAWGVGWLLMQPFAGQPEQPVARMMED